MLGAGGDLAVARGSSAHGRCGRLLEEGEWRRRDGVSAGEAEGCRPLDPSPGRSFRAPATPIRLLPPFRNTTHSEGSLDVDEKRSLGPPSRAQTIAFRRFDPHRRAVWAPSRSDSLPPPRRSWRLPSGANQLREACPACRGVEPAPCPTTVMTSSLVSLAKGYIVEVGEFIRLRSRAGPD